MNRVHVEDRKSIDEQLEADGNLDVDSYETEGVSKVESSVYPPNTPSEYTAPELNNSNVDMNDSITENRGQVSNYNNEKRLQNKVQNAGPKEFDASTESVMRAPVMTAPLRLRSFEKPTRNQTPAIGSFSQVIPRQPGPLRQAWLVGPRPRYLRPIQPRPCQSLIRMNSQHTQTVFEPLVIKLDSPDSEVKVMATPSGHGCSDGDGRSFNPNALSGVTLPASISITRTVDISADKTPAATMKSLAKALMCLGETEGEKRLVTFNLTESQVEGLRTLGLSEHKRMF